MPLSRIAAQHAAEIKLQDWSDSPYRADKAGHNRDMDGRSRSERVLAPQEADTVKLNVMWNVAQVLAYNDPNFDVYEFAEACGVNTRTPNGSPKSGVISYGLRSGTGPDGTFRFHVPGAYELDTAEPAQP